MHITDGPVVFIEPKGLRGYLLAERLTYYKLYRLVAVGLPFFWRINPAEADAFRV